MDNDYRTEEEQIEAIKSWWQDNGRSTLLGILLVLVGVGSFEMWKQNKQTYRESASVAYHELLESVSTLQEPDSAEQATTARHLAQTLKSDFSDTTYAQLAALILAKLDVDNGELANAESELRWVLENKPSAALEEVVTLRLARVTLAKGDAEAALDLLSGQVTSGQQSLYDEISGDAYVALGQLDQAREAYNKAINGIEEAKRNQRPVLQMKLDDLTQLEGDS